MTGNIAHHSLGTEWSHLAACRPGQGDPERFFVVNEENRKGDLADDERRAVLVCLSCPVSGNCLMKALTMSPAPVGVWGGTTYRERQKMARPSWRRDCLRCKGRDYASPPGDTSIQICRTCGLSWFSKKFK